MNGDPSLRRGNRLKQAGIAAVATLALTACASSEGQGLRADGTGIPHSIADYTAQAKSMAARMSAGEAVPNVTIEQGGRLLVTPEQTGVQGIASIIRPVRLGPNAYALFTTNSPESGLNGYAVITSAPIEPLPLDGTPKDQPPVPGPPAHTETVSMAMACNTGQSFGPEGGTYTLCEPAIGNAPSYYDEHTVLVGAGNYSGK